MSKSTQEDRIVDYMQRFGGITQLEALRDLGVMRLAPKQGCSDKERNGCYKEQIRRGVPDIEV